MRDLTAIKSTNTAIQGKNHEQDSIYVETDVTLVTLHIPMWNQWPYCVLLQTCYFKIAQVLLAVIALQTLSLFCCC